jgi:tripartite-type tricarboxylate transporter receptor subunit TctC
MPTSRRFGSLLIILIALAAVADTAAAAEQFPSRPITVIVPFPAGGPTDTTARIVAESIRSSLGQPVVVENTSGAANGSVGMGRCARAAADGYTICFGHWGTNVINGAMYSLPYDVMEDFDPVALISSSPEIVLARPGLPARNLGELIKWVLDNPGKATFGTSGIGSPPHLAGILFEQLTGAHFQYVHYRGAAPAIQDLLGGRIDLDFSSPTGTIGHVRSGALKAFAVAAKTRLQAAPEIPTADEAGLPDLHLSNWIAVWAPKGAPKEAVTKINAAIAAGLADPVVRSRLAELGQDLFPPELASVDAFHRFHQSEIGKWWPIVKAAGIKAQ